MADNYEVLGGSNQWNVSFSREAHNWEVEVFASFFQVLHSARVRQGCADRLWWISSKRDSFTVKLLFASLACTEGRRFPWKSVRQTQAPPRAIFFVWSAALGKILTLDNLKRRQVFVTNRSCMCKRSEDTVDHLLLHCEVAYALWSAFFGRFGLSWVMLRRVSDLLACRWSTGRRESAGVWKMMPTCFFWCRWRERNNRSFEDLEGSLEDILSSCFHTLYLWTVAHIFPVSISYNDFLVHFSLSSEVILLYTPGVLGGTLRF